MLIISSILLLTFGVLASATEDDFCQSRPNHCFSPDIHLDLPDDEDELDKICPIIIPRFKCLVEFKNKCNGKDLAPQFQIVDNVYGLFVEACDNESKLHKELTIHLPCISESLDSHRNTCSPIIQEVLEELISDLNIDFEEDMMNSVNGNYAKFVCMSQAIETACFVASTSVKCSEKTGQMVGDVINQIGIMDLVCPENILQEEVAATIEILQPLMELAIATEEILSSVK